MTATLINTSSINTSSINTSSINTSSINTSSITSSRLLSSVPEARSDELLALDSGIDGFWLPDPVDAACLDHDPELFFADTPEGVEQAKRVCVDCPVRQECLAGALRRREPHGVWGGELFVAGVVVPRKRPRGRPRKEQVAA